MGICSHCQLRYSGVIVREAYTLMASSCADLVCPSCMGLLQQRYHSLGATLKEKMKDYRGISSFMSSIRLPASLIVRHWACLAYLQSVSPKEGYELGTVIEVKEVLKYFIQQDLKEGSGLDHEQKSPFLVEFQVEDMAQDYEEFLFMKSIPKSGFKMKLSRKKGGQVVVHGASVENVAQAASALDINDFIAAHKWPLSVPTDPWRLGIPLVTHSCIYIGGRYNKLKRHISHSPWRVGGRWLAEESVEGLIEPHLTRFLGATGHAFASSGREDSDVLMLGNGRPFYLEFKNPKISDLTAQELANLESEINNRNQGKVLVSHLCKVTRDQIKILNDSVQTKSKSYRTLIKVYGAVSDEQITQLNNIKNLAIKQKNPTRVPRRADLVRDKVIESIHNCERATESMISDFYSSGVPKIAICPQVLASANDAEYLSSNEIAQVDPVTAKTVYFGPKTNDKTSTETEATEATTIDKEKSQPSALHNVTSHNSTLQTTTTLVLELTTSAGTYIKEFCHGDSGKTVPSLKSLLNVDRIDVLALDVVEIHMNWPNK